MGCQDTGGALPRPASAQEQGSPDVRLDRARKAGNVGLLPQGTHTMPSKPCRPHFLPATWQPNLSASCMLFPGGRDGGWIGFVFWARLGPSPAPPAEVLTLGQAEDDGGIEGVSRPQRIHHPGWRESIRVEQPSIRAQGIGALLSPGTDKRGPARPSIQLVLAQPWPPASFPLPRADPGVQAHPLPTPKASSWLLQLTLSSHDCTSPSGPPPLTGSPSAWPHLC